MINVVEWLSYEQQFPLSLGAACEKINQVSDDHPAARSEIPTIPARICQFLSCPIDTDWDCECVSEPWNIPLPRMIVDTVGTYRCREYLPMLETQSHLPVHDVRS